MERTKDLVVKGGSAFRGGDQASHVLLAACGDQETAREDHSGSGERERQGCFTRAFLQEMKDLSRGNISYSALIEEFPPLTNWKGCVVTVSIRSCHLMMLKWLQRIIEATPPLYWS